jgi:hypothetical protein
MSRLLILTLLTVALAATVGVAGASAGHSWGCSYRNAGASIYMGPSSFSGPTRPTAYQRRVCMHFRYTGWHRISNYSNYDGVSWCGFQGHGMSAFLTAKDALLGNGACRFVKPYFKQLGFKRL